MRPGMRKPMYTNLMYNLMKNASSSKLPKKYATKMKETKKKLYMHKNVIDGRKHFISHIRKTGENNFNELWVNYPGHNKGTIYLVNQQMGAKVMTFKHRHMNGCHMYTIYTFMISQFCKLHLIPYEKLHKCCKFY